MYPQRQADIITVTVNTTNGSYSLGDQQTLAGKVITGIVATKAVSGTKSLGTGNTIVTSQNAYLILESLTGKVIIKEPLLNFEYSGGTPFMRVFPMVLENINWQKSRIEYARNVVPAAAGDHELVIYYQAETPA
jgi:hypothetical protein